ncbi:MAG: ATP-binding cassette domain-containing protein [Eubacteriales bacterium]|jgi:putative ABC transport system ATP-binding protein|nr:ATP-binding cassette domain-containing protein [Clostridiales bacterium]
MYCFKETYRLGQVEINALNEIDLSIEKGSLTVIFGASGSGKSTLLHCIAGVDNPDSGSVLIGGQDIYKLNAYDSAVFRRRNIGLVYQFFNLLPTLTGRQNILLLNTRHIYSQALRFR